MSTTAKDKSHVTGSFTKVYARHKIAVDSELSAINLNSKHMAREFDKARKAWSLRTDTTQRTGSLDLRRIQNYRTSDQIFKSKVVSQEGKSHFVYVLVDFSSSMDQDLTYAISEAYTIARFAERVGIGFKIVSFTSSHSAKNGYSPDIEGLQNMSHNFCGRVLFSSEFSKTKNASNFKYLYASFLYGRAHSKLLPLGGTPLFEAILLSYEDMIKIRRSHGIQDMNFITITDGCGSEQLSVGGYVGGEYTTTRRGVYSTGTTSDSFNGGRVVAEDMTLIDPLNNNREFTLKSTDDIGHYSYALSANTLDIMRKNKINVMGYYIGHPMRDLNADDIADDAYYRFYNHRDGIRIGDPVQTFRSKYGHATTYSNFNGYGNFMILHKPAYTQTKETFNNDRKELSRSVGECLAEGYRKSSR